LAVDRRFAWNLSATKNRRFLIMDCAIEGSDIFILYAGNPRYLPDAFNVLHNMFPAPLPARS
jgi:hypothetical protein